MKTLTNLSKIQLDPIRAFNYEHQYTIKTTYTSFYTHLHTALYSYMYYFLCLFVKYLVRWFSFSLTGTAGYLLVLLEQQQQRF